IAELLDDQRLRAVAVDDKTNSAAIRSRRASIHDRRKTHDFPHRIRHSDAGFIERQVGSEGKINSRAACIKHSLQTARVAIKVRHKRLPVRQIRVLKSWCLTNRQIEA